MKPWHWIVILAAVAAVAYAWGAYSTPDAPVVTVTVGDPTLLPNTGSMSADVTDDSDLAVPGDPGFSG